MTGKIKGITIEIGGDTQKLNKALEDVNKKTRDVQSELRQVERLLKLDPKNTELLAQKQKLLAEAVDNSREKLDRLKVAQEQVNEQFRKGEINEEQYRAFQREVVKAEQELEKFEKQLRETGLTAEQVGKKLQDAGKKMTGIGKDLSMKVTAPLVAAGAASFKMAADLQDAMGATEQIFKGAADSVKTWADNLESYYGIAEGEALEYANMMGSMLVNIGGLTEEQAAKQAQTLIELAGDLTAMYGGTTADAVRALTGALKGNNTMLDNYGMAVNDAMIKTKALEMGLIAEGEQLDLAGKQAATLALIMEQTGAAQGQAAREAEGASGGMRALATEIKNLSTDIGEVLLPVITPLLNRLGDIVKKFSELSPETQKTIVIIAGLAAAIGPLLLIFGPLISVIGTLITGLGAMSTAMAGGATLIAGLTAGFPVLGSVIGALTGPIGLVIAAIAALITAGVYLYKNWEEVKYRGLQAWGSLKAFVLEQIREMLKAFEGLLSWIPKVGDTISKTIENLNKEILAEKNIMSVRDFEFRMKKAADAAKELEAEIKKTEDTVKETATPVQELGNEIKSLGGKASNAGDKVTKAAEDTRAEWEKTADILSSRLQILRTEYEIAAMAAEEKSNKAEQLRLKLDHLSQQMNVQRELVAAIKRGYDEMVAAKGEDVVESQKLQLRLVQEIRAQAELEKQIRETTQALRDHIQQFNELAVEIDKVEKKYREDLVAAHEEYQRRVAKVNDKLIEDERRVQAEYEKTLDDRARALRDFVGLFDEVTSKDVSGEQLLKNLRGQVDAFENWQENIADLAAKGVDEGLIDELRQMGPKAGPEIAALNTLTDKQLQEYVALWRTKNQKARQEAVNQLQQQREEMQQKLVEIRQAAKEQLEIYRQEWQKKNAEIRKNAEEELKRIQQKFNETAEAGTKHGIHLILNFAQGMESQFDRLRQAVEEARAIAAELDPAMRHSPSLVDKVRSGLAEILAAYQDLARKIQNINLGSVSMPALAGASGSVVYTYNNDNRVINITVQDGEDLLRTLRRLGVRIP